MKKYTSVLMSSCFLLSMGGNSIASEFIIQDSYPHSLAKKKVNHSKFYNEYQKIYTELLSYKKIQSNWDGYGGIRPNDKIIDTTKNFLTILEKNKIINPNIMVSGAGEIGLFWKKQNTYIEVDFDEENLFTFFYDIDNNLYGEEDIVWNENIPEKLINVLNNLQNKSSTQNSSLFSLNTSSTKTIALIV